MPLMKRAMFWTVVGRIGGRLFRATNCVKPSTLYAPERPRSTCFTDYVTSRNLCSSRRILHNSTGSILLHGSYGFMRWAIPWQMRYSSIKFDTGDGVVRFGLDYDGDFHKNYKLEETLLPEDGVVVKKRRFSRKAKLKELRFYRLKAKKKLKSPNPEVRIKYKLEKAKRKEVWLIEKLRKFELPKALPETHDPEILTEEERFYLKRTGEKKKHYVPVGRRGVFGGVVLNMHLHWKRHETVKVVCKPCKPGQIHEIAEELARLSKGMIIDVKPNNIVIFYRGKNYVRPDILSPPDTLSKNKALEKYKYEQSLEHTSQFIERLEKEFEEYQEHFAHYRRMKESSCLNSVEKS